MRTDGDSWDITTSVGSTALRAAAARALEAQKPEPLAVDPYAQDFCRAVGGDWSALLDGAAPDHWLNTESGAHYQTFQAARTRYFDDHLRAAADAGTRQVVIVAAGLDSRAHRLAWPYGTVIYELDQPKVLEFKRAVLDAHGHAATAQRREVAVDLREDWPTALRDAGFEPGQPSAWLAEGLLLYLPRTAQEQLFVGIDTFASTGSDVGVQEQTPLDPAMFETARAKELADTSGQDRFFTLPYNEQHATAADWFTARGWQAVATPLADWIRGLARPLPTPESEAAAMIGAVSLVSAIRK